MATVDNDIIKITLSNTASGNVITVSPGISALSSVSLSLNDLSNVDTSGITNGQTIVYENGNFVAGDAGAVKTVNNENPDLNGNVDISLNDVSQVSITTPSNNEFLKYSAGQWVNDEIEISYVNGLQTALDDKATISSVPQSLNDLSDVTITGTPSGNQALLYDTATSSFKALASYTNRFEDEVEISKNAIDTASSIFIERSYSVKSDGDGIFIDPNPDTPTSGNVIVRKIYHKSGFITSSDVIGDYTLIHTFSDDTAYSSTVSTFEGFRDGNTYGTAPFTLIQVWEEQAAAPAFTGLLNESYGSGAAAAYSVRRLNGNYTGSAVQLERTSDNSFQDIGFDVNGDLDESAITTFCTGTTCKVRTWYDQSGSANDATQTNHNNQPTIYTGGAIVKDNGRVAFTSSKTTTLSLSTRITDVQSVFLTLAPTDVNVTPKTDWGYFLLGDTTTSDYHSDYNDNWLSPTFTSTSVRNGSNYLNGTSANLTTTARTEQQYLVSLISTSATNTVGTISKDRTQTNRSWVGSRQEIVLYNSDKSTDRTSIESNIGDYFTQNTPLLDTYSGAAAAYSLRKLRTAYTGAAIEVYNGTSYQDIGFNVFGELDTVSLAAFCGGNNGFVSKWYDQSGNTNDATQTTTASQPKIYDSVTGVVTENGKPAVEFIRASATKLAFTTGLSSQTNIIAIAKNTDTSWGTLVGESFAGGLRCLSSALWDSSTNNDDFYHNGSLFLDGVQLSTGTAASNVQRLIFANAASGGYTDTLVNIGEGYSGRQWSGPVQEVILYASDQSSNRTGIEDNINTFYSIY